MALRERGVREHRYAHLNGIKIHNQWRKIMRMAKVGGWGGPCWGCSPSLARHARVRGVQSPHVCVHKRATRTQAARARPPALAHPRAALQVEELRRDIEILSQNHEREVDRKDAIIQVRCSVCPSPTCAHL